MAAYFIVVGLLTALALLHVAMPRAPDWRYLALAILLTFGALRFETGYDWLVYEEYLSESVDIWTAATEGIPETTVPMEPFWQLLNILIVTIGGSITLLFAIVTTFNLVVLDRVASRISSAVPIMWLAYFGLLFIPAQMSSLRQGIASSFVLIGLALVAQKRPLWAAFSILVGAGFQVSVAMFLPLIVLARFKADWRFVTLGIGISVALFANGINPTNAILEIVIPFVPGVIAEKLAFYINLPPARLSTSVMLLIAGYCALLVILYGFVDEEEDADPYVNMARWLTLVVIAAHLVFAAFPVVWNRVMFVTLPWQIAAVCRLGLYNRRIKDLQALGVLALAGVAFGGLYVTLVRPEAKVLVPYQSLFHVWLYPNDYLDARYRVDEWMEDYEGIQTELAR